MIEGFAASASLLAPNRTRVLAVFAQRVNLKPEAPAKEIVVPTFACPSGFNFRVRYCG